MKQESKGEPLNWHTRQRFPERFMLVRFDDKRVEGQFLNFDDKGIVSKGAKTRKFAVTSRYNGSLLGYVKFFAQWRQYAFFPINCILNKDCMRELADYCVELTAAHREKRKAFPGTPEIPLGVVET